MYRVPVLKTKWVKGPHLIPNKKKGMKNTDTLALAKLSILAVTVTSSINIVNGAMVTRIITFKDTQK